MLFSSFEADFEVKKSSQLNSSQPANNKVNPIIL
jgi:hypothetical protein